MDTTLMTEVEIKREEIARHVLPPVEETGVNDNQEDDMVIIL